MSNRCIVNFAQGGNYPAGQRRLARQCGQLGIPFIGYHEYPRGCPDHHTSPYAFKPHCIKHAMEAHGYDTVLWMDASANIQKHPLPIFEVAERDGVFMSANYGIRTGKWSTDECLAKHGITREQAWEIEHCSALIFCVSRLHPLGRQIQDEYLAASLDGVSFPGPHRYAEGREPSKGVEGHRHDQTVLSILAWKHGVKLHPNTVWLDYGKACPNAIVAADPVD